MPTASFPLLAGSAGRGIAAPSRRHGWETLCLGAQFARPQNWRLSWEEGTTDDL
jgi:hypothetical protein